MVVVEAAADREEEEEIEAATTSSNEVQTSEVREPLQVREMVPGPRQLQAVSKATVVTATTIEVGITIADWFGRDGFDVTIEQ